jgi:uncharacterized paraquat-inducible protein A
MALKYTHRPGGSAYCPKCKEAISREANICPHCRSDLTENEEWQAQKSSGGVGCATIIILGLIASCIIGIPLVSMIA